MAMENEITAVIPVHNWDNVKGNLVRILELPNIFRFNLVLVIDSFTPEQQTEFLGMVASSGATIQDIDFVDFNSASMSRNVGLREVRSRYVCFWDSDDLPILEGYLELAVKMHEDNLDMAIGQLVRVDILDSREIQPRKTITKNLWDLGMDPGFTRILYQTDVVKTVEFPVLTLAEDLVFLSRLFSTTTNLKFFSTLVYEYRIGQTFQASRRFLKPGDQIEAIRLLDEISRNHKNQISFALIRFIRLKLILGLLKRFNRLDLSEKHMVLKFFFGEIRLKTVIVLLRLRFTNRRFHEN
jgi:glycosyltransferase involved in cell wall biosynthesis